MAGISPLDTLSKTERSIRMSHIRGKDTKPELLVRSLIHRMGYRFRLHGRGLPGKPDIVFPARSKVIFVHGCFWHRHAGCPQSRTPKTNVEFWTRKFEMNVSRDRRVENDLKEKGWDVLAIWECELAHMEDMKYRIQAFLGGSRNGGGNEVR